MDDNFNMFNKRFSRLNSVISIIIMFSNRLRNWIAIIKVYLYCKGIWWKPKMLTWTSFCSFFTAPAGCVPNNYLPLVLEPLHGFKKVIELKARIFEQLCWSLTYIHFQTSNDLFSNDNSGFYDYIIRWNSFEFLLPNFDRFFCYTQTRSRIGKKNI